MSTYSKHRIYAPLLILGAGVLLFRAFSLMSEGAIEIFVWWVFALLILEFLLLILAVFVSTAWFFNSSEHAAYRTLKAATLVVVVHAIRVFIFVFGRTGPWADFDVASEQRALHSGRWSWAEVYFASAMSVSSIIVLAYAWRLRSETRDQ